MIKKSLGLKNCKQLRLPNKNLEQLVEQLSFSFDKYLNFNFKFNKHYKVKCGCGVAHTVAHTTPVREDLGSILHPSPGRHFRKLSSPFFQTTDLKTISLSSYFDKYLTFNFNFDQHY
jgi:hypothetical protein